MDDPAELVAVLPRHVEMMANLPLGMSMVEWNIVSNDILAAAARITSDAARIRELEQALNTPETQDFAKAVHLEAAHQRHRWGAEHDDGKSPFDWFWLVGYLAQKAASSAVTGDVENAKHHTISTAAALANWHMALRGSDTRMRPGIAAPAQL